MLCARALLSVSEFSLAMSAFSALCIALKLLDITLLDNEYRRSITDHRW